jgi:hypothetical protein
MSVEKYLEQARRNSHMRNRNFGADGKINDYGFSGGDALFNNYPAAGRPTQPTSRPYIITITNTGAAVSNFDILGSNEYLFPATGTWSAGSLTIGNVTISSGITNITYQGLLQFLYSSPFKTNYTYLFSSTAGQITTSITLTTKAPNGNEAKMVMTPTIDPYQQQSTSLILQQPYAIDAYTKLTFAQIMASAVITIQIYPIDDIQLPRGLNGQDVASSFSQPMIQRPQPVIPMS